VIFNVELDDIGEKAFWYCDSLQPITIRNAVGTIKDNAFSYCRGLMTVALGDGL
jgi:hypothetical protein